MELLVNKDGYLTVYLSLVFGILLSLILALVEGAATGACRLQSQMVADLGIDSVFAEYNREVLSQYGVFFIDDAYGSENGSIGNIQTHLSDFMSYNMVPPTDLGNKVIGNKNLLKLKNPYLQIEEVAFATDDNGQVWKKQACDYMEQKYGASYFQNIMNQIGTMESSEVLGMDTDSMLQDNVDTLNDFLDDKDEEEIKEIVESDGGNGVTTGLLLDAPFKFSGEMSLAGRTVSSKSVNVSEYVSHRNTNQGVGLSHTEESYDAWDELVYSAYLMEKCGNYRTPDEDGKLSYEIEYILWGNDTDKENLSATVGAIKAIRDAANYVTLQKDTGKQAVIDTIAIVINGLTGCPYEAISQVINITWARCEAERDVETLLNGGSVPFVKEPSEWKTDLGSMVSGSTSSGTDQYAQKGLTYENYITFFLYASSLNVNDKTMRSLDIVEMDIRNTAGNEHFRIDNCVDYMKVSFGFVDAKDKEYVFTRSMYYESY